MLGFSTTSLPVKKGSTDTMDSRDEQALKAVKLYYDKGLSQAEVAHELGVSRPTAAKLIQHGRDRGFVTITVHDPRDADNDLAGALVKTFKLQAVRLVHLPRHTDPDLLVELGRGGAELLDQLVTDGMTIGISWGNTLRAVAGRLRHRNLHDVQIIQLKGGAWHSKKATGDIETINSFCNAFNATAVTLPLPVMFDDATTRTIVEQDRHIARILNLGAKCDIAVFTVGDNHPHAIADNLTYLSDEELAHLSRTAVGDACSRFFTATGTLACPPVDERTVGISLQALKSRPIRILVAGSSRKTEAIATALSMGLATHLVIDRPTAERIIADHVTAKK